MLSDSEVSLFRVNREILHFVQNDMLGEIPFFNSPLPLHKICKTLFYVADPAFPLCL